MNVNKNEIARMMALLIAHTTNNMKAKRKNGYIVQRLYPVGTVQDNREEHVLSIVSLWYVDKYGKIECLN